jgi:hypothetical protein
MYKPEPSHPLFRFFFQRTMVLFSIIVGMDQAFKKATPKQTAQVQRSLHSSSSSVIVGPSNV